MNESFTLPIASFEPSSTAAASELRRTNCDRHPVPKFEFDRIVIMVEKLGMTNRNTEKRRRERLCLFAKPPNDTRFVKHAKVLVELRPTAVPT